MITTARMYSFLLHDQDTYWRNITLIPIQNLYDNAMLVANVSLRAICGEELSYDTHSMPYPANRLASTSTSIAKPGLALNHTARPKVSRFV